MSLRLPKLLNKSGKSGRHHLVLDLRGNAIRSSSLAMGLSYITFIMMRYIPFKGFPGGASGKEPACQCRRHERHWFDPWVRKTPWRRAWQSPPVFLPGETRGQWNLVGYSP